MGSPEFADPYLDAETGLLRNKVGAKAQSALDKAEGDLVFARLVQLMAHPVEPTGDLDELRAIHRHLFQDIYDWAGELRTVDIRKNVEGAQFFLPVPMIGRAAAYCAEELRADNDLRGMSREQFIDRLAYHYDQFNYLHPFREGNGRTQRVFWNRVARDAGWQLDWRKVHGATNDRASRAAAEERDLGPLREMLDQIVSQASPQGERDAAWRVAEHAHLSFPMSAVEGVRLGMDGGELAPAQADAERSLAVFERAETQRLEAQADQEGQQSAEVRVACEGETDLEERARALAEAEQREGVAGRAREDGRSMYDSSERREGVARELEARGISQEAVAVRMRADVSQAKPVTEAVSSARGALKARRVRGPHGVRSQRSVPGR